MSRHTLAIAIALALFAGGGGVAGAQTSAAEKADRLNNEGQALFNKGQYDAAAQKFREAILFSAEGRFYFNLCYTLNKMSKYRDAITACEAVAPNGASKPLQEKATKLLEALRAHVANTSEDPNLNPGDPNTGDPNTGDPNTGDPNTGDPNNPNTGDPNNPNTGDPNNPPGNLPPPPAAGGVVEQKAPPPIGAYKWAIGGDFGVLASSFGDEGTYGGGGAAFRLHADFMLAERRHLGVQGYFGATSISPGDFNERLEVIDLGGAGFIHRRLKDRIWANLLAGVHIALMQPESFSGGTSVATLGGRGEAGLSFLLGPRGEHVINLAVALNIYGPASQGSAEFDPKSFGLDKPAATFAIGVGYAYRFSTPFGSTPVFTLE